MGNSQSHVQQQTPHLSRLKELFQQLADENNQSKTIKQDSFEKYFKFQGCTKLGELIYRYINKDENGLDQNGFVKQMEYILDTGSSSCGQLEMYFRIFSNNQQTITYQELCEMCKICSEMWLYLEETDDNPVAMDSGINIVDLIVQSMMSDTSNPVSIKHCVEWTSEHVCCLFNPVHSWLVTLTLHGKTKLQSCQPVHSIISWTDHPDMLLNKPLFWLLSMVLPDYYVAFKYDNLWSNEAVAGHCAPDKQWTVLYNSIQDGQSYNRFKHHCFSYNGPSVILIMVQSGPIIVVAVDSNWKESSLSWGKSNCMLLQIQQNLQILKEGENIIFLNERTRGLPTGLLLGNRPNKPLVTISIDLTTAVLHYKHDTTTHNITRLEVWGCAGLAAKEKQKEQQRWERKQAEKLQKVKLPGKWDENPDRAILEMAGITSNHGHRQ